MDREAMGPWGFLYRDDGLGRLIFHTQSVVKAWKMVNRFLGWEGRLTNRTLLWSSALLREVEKLQGFKRWELIGIEYLGDMWRGGSLLTFEELKQENEMGQSECYKLLQLGHTLHRHIVEGEQLPESSPLEDRLLTESLLGRAISLVYKKIMNNSSDPLGSLRAAWEND
ncbi:hypothetical protein NDU88_002073 [Pleurodeles waltl]|uniref:Uncharacterized protein n=1 Tax=Pleurodeles waltl TaxID=8319 RepID=A0AAV7W2C0_PLEWA|nr:hypothetical protein NDU88_002073 [Pleurodeles waltl]